MAHRKVDWALLSGLSEQDREQLLAGAKVQGFSRGEVVVREGEYGESLHLVHRGRLSARISSSHGRSLTLGVLSPGDAFGEQAVTGQLHQRRFSVVALEPSEILAVSGQAFHALCRRNPTVEPAVIRLLTERVERLSDRLLEVSYVSVDRRIYHRLLELSEIYDDGSQEISIPLTQDDIAGLAGTTRPTVNNVLQRLQRQGIIDLGRGCIRMLNRTELCRRVRA